MYNNNNNNGGGGGGSSNNGKESIGIDMDDNNNGKDKDNYSSSNNNEIEIDEIKDDVNASLIDIAQQKQQQMQQQQQQQQTLTLQQQHQNEMTKIMMVIAFYFFISISLVFLNKLLMKNLDFKYPLFITWYQQIVSFVMIFVMCKIAPGVPALNFLPPFEFKYETAQRVMPLTAVLTMMIVFNNLCLEYVEVSFYQVARSLTICFSILLTYLILKSKTSYKASMACGIVFFGFILGSAGEINFSWYGIVFGLLSSFFVALYSIYVKRILPVCEGNEWKLSIYNTAISIVFILPLIFLGGEASTLLQEEVLYTGEFWLVMTIAGAMGYLISIAIFMQIKHTSPLTNAISGTVKACVQTILAVMIWGNEISFQNGFGIFLVISGSFYYSYVRYQEMRK
ncbi:hypothetical protein SAMD00019534_015350 [Acytostelium subglobosum LB1]|uniref:hypothetical protein n=1 Tax=Acytostelium subglobosum LB1 TaxID=1410327 RepID=UPI000644849F|nr:hypothetical protein SAMD00019534_015350 [Acytostelium subglobosum LB1]GAM18360.1 hypothetical protein SAMD00019534_015350 [Acytostelium subglobosum LB1]|eukprot:XP_012757580.1 hypothetical protein SAMD00019534_015350 [Acytostelium subglobosum LB1]